MLYSTGWYHIDVAATGAGDGEFLSLFARDSLGLARVSTNRMNAALQAMEQRASKH